MRHIDLASESLTREACAPNWASSMYQCLPGPVSTTSSRSPSGLQIAVAGRAPTLSIQMQRFEGVSGVLRARERDDDGA